MKRKNLLPLLFGAAVGLFLCDVSYGAPDYYNTRKMLRAASGKLTKCIKQNKMSATNKAVLKNQLKVLGDRVKVGSKKYHGNARHRTAMQLQASIRQFSARVSAKCVPQKVAKKPKPKPKKKKKTQPVVAVNQPEGTSLSGNDLQANQIEIDNEDAQ